MSASRKNAHATLLITLILMVIIIGFDYLIFNDILSLPESFLKNTFFAHFYLSARKLTFAVRAIIILLTFLYAWYIPSYKNEKKHTDKQRLYFKIIYFSSSFVFIIGFINIFVYDIYIFPMLYGISTFFCFRSFKFLDAQLDEESVFNGLNKKGKEKLCAFTFQTKEGELVLPNADYGSLTDGGTGAGKSLSIIKPFIYEGVSKGFSGVFYDYNGDPTKEDSLLITRTVYYAYECFKNKIITKPALINFTDLSKSTRVNIYSKRYLKNKLDFNSLSDSLMKNLEKQWKEKPDFWAKNAISYVSANSYMLSKHHEKYCTLPHIVALCLTDYNKVFDWLAQDEEVCRMFKPMFTSYKLNAEGQTAGSVSSSQLPLTFLDIPEIFWVLSEDEFNLDVNDPENPSLLCLANAPHLKPALSPVISAIALVCMNLMNMPKKNKSQFVFDEIHSVLLHDLDNWLAVVRKYNVCSMFGYQTFNQFVRDYGENSARIIRDTLGNQFQGMTGNEKTGEYWSQMLGDVKKQDVSFTDGMDSFSTSERLSREKALQVRDIATQDIGHFHGKIAGGKPPIFRAQFIPYQYEEQESKLIIPSRFPVNTGDRDLDKQILDKMVEENYRKIHKDVEGLLK